MASEVKIPDSFRDTIRLLSKSADLYHYLLTHLNTILETHSQSMVYIQLGLVVDKTKIEQQLQTFVQIHGVLSPISTRIQFLFNVISQLQARILSA